MFSERTSQRSAKIKKGRHEEIGILQVSIAVLPVLIFSGCVLADEILCVFPDCFLAIINCFIAVPFMYTYLYVHTYVLLVWWCCEKSGKVCTHQHWTAGTLCVGGGKQEHSSPDRFIVRIN